MFCFILCISCVGDTSPRQMFEQVVAGVCASLIQYILNTCVELMSPFVGIVDKGQATFPCHMQPSALVWIMARTKSDQTGQVGFGEQ